MAFALDPALPVVDEVRRVAAEGLGSACASLRGDAGEDDAKAVHSARKRLKELRGLVRLVRGALGEDAFRALDATFRDAGRQLSSLRDADVLVATAEDLAERHGEDAAAATLAVVRAVTARRDAARAGEQAATSVQSVLAALDEAAAGVDGWSLEGDGFDALEDGLRRTYRQGRGRMYEATAEGSAEASHDWRKRVKHLWYHLQLLSPSWPAVLEPAAEEAHRLSDLLGDAHDLEVLALVVRDEDLDLDAGAVQVVTTLADTRRHALDVEAHDLGARLYAESPRAFGDRLRAYVTAAASTAGS